MLTGSQQPHRMSARTRSNDPVFRHRVLTGTCALRSCRNVYEASRTKRQCPALGDKENAARQFPSGQFYSGKVSAPCARVNVSEYGQLSLTPSERKELMRLRIKLRRHKYALTKRYEDRLGTINGEPTRTMHPPADNVGLQRTPRIDMMDKGNSGTSVPFSGTKPIERGAEGRAEGEDGRSQRRYVM